MVFTVHVLKQQLQLRKVCSRWVLHLLTGEQNQNKVEYAEQLLEKHCDQRSKGLNEARRGSTYFNQIRRGTIKNGLGKTRGTTS